MSSAGLKGHRSRSLCILKLKLLEHSSYIPEWKNWLLPVWKFPNARSVGDGIHPEDQLLNRVADQTLWVISISMNWGENTQAGVPPNARNGASSCYSVCSIMQPPWKEGAWEDFPKALPNQTTRDGQSDGPWASICLDPFRVHWWHDIESCQTSLPRGVCAGSQFAPLLASGGVHSRITSWTGLVHGQSWLPEQTRARLDPLCKVGDTPVAVFHHELSLLQLGPGVQSQPNI